MSNLMFKTFVIAVTVILVLLLVGCVLCVADHYLHFSCRRDLTERVFNVIYSGRWIIMFIILLLILWIRDEL